MREYILSITATGNIDVRAVIHTGPDDEMGDDYSMNTKHEHKDISLQMVGYIAVSVIVFTLSLLFVPLALFFIPLIIILLALREVEKDLTADYPKKKLHL